MNVVSRKALKSFAGAHNFAAEPLDNWYRRARKAKWKNLAELRLDYPPADRVGKFTVFNVGGNKFTLITKINYVGQTVYIKRVLTHREYSKGGWKNDC
ncbi:MAG TPA: type II toxin-antitoxin system HigB family toxin [Blastocatellia bacterium]|nr:type II toxin-antitoxin system HigB family toxin [Blastocatellia bacterium]